MSAMTDLRELKVRRPDEGWLPAVLVAIMCVTLAWAVDEPAWVNGRPQLTDCLPVFALFGAFIGFIGPKVGWGRWKTHGIGALYAGLLIPVFAGWAKYPGSSISEAFYQTATGTVNAYLDVAWRGKQFTDEEIHYILVLGILVWATCQFASYAVFGHRRPLNGIVAIGIALVANMSLTTRNQLPYMVTFTGAALFLLISMHAFDERTTWLRRRIGDPSAISALYLRGGTLFIVVALVGSLFLTNRAASSPLAGAWSSIDDQLVPIGETIGRLFPVGGDLKPGGNVTFGPVAQIRNQWFSDDNPAFTATLPVNAPDGIYWKAKTYNQFAYFSWQQSTVDKLPTPADGALLTGTAEDPNPKLTTSVTASVHPEGYADSALLSPGTPTKISRDSTVLVAGEQHWYAGVDVNGIRDGYDVTASQITTDEKVISGNLLAAASRDYPKDVTDLYTEVPPDALGPQATNLLTSIHGSLTQDDPYDLAVAIESYLRNPDHFTYTTDLRDVNCQAQSAVECFVQYRKGYCLHYASTMAMMLRAAYPDDPVPTRLVQGFLPGTRIGTTDTVLNKDAHAWVEVYFPGYGWIPFDPTGSISQMAILPPGAKVNLPTAAPSDNREPAPLRTLFGGDKDRPQGQTTAPTQTPGDRSMFILLTILLTAVVVVIAFAAWLRGPRGEVSPDTAWLAMARAASRFGFAPKPTQTVYEYAADLGELVPVARQDLHTVAVAKVETSYAKVRLGGARLQAVRDATRRLRISLLRLLFRRPRRGRPRGLK